MNNQSEQKEEKTQSKGVFKSTGYYANQPTIRDKGPGKLRQQFGRGMTYFLVIAAGIIFYFALLRLTDISDVFMKFFDVLKPIIYGLAIAYLLNPIVKYVEKYLCPFLDKKCPQLKGRRKLARSVGIFVALIILFAVVVTLCNMLIPELYSSIRDMVYTVPSQLNDLMNTIGEMDSYDSTLGRFMKSVVEESTTYVQTWMRTDLLKQTNILMTNLTTGVIAVVRELLNLLIGLIVSIYVLFAKETFSAQTKKIVYAVLKPSQANMVLHLTTKSNEIFGGFIIGKIIDSIIIGILCFLGLSALNMPYTLLVSVIVGVTNVVPFFGPYIGAIPSAVLIMLEDPRLGIYFVIFILILQQLDGNIIGPKILGDSTGLSAFWVVFAILLGGGMFGFVGMILGVPTFAVIYYIVRMLVSHKLEKKSLPVETECYSEMSYVDGQGNFVHAEEAVRHKENESAVKAAEEKKEGE